VTVYILRWTLSAVWVFMVTLLCGKCLIMENTNFRKLFPLPVRIISRCLLPTYLPTHPPTYLPTYLPAYLSVTSMYIHGMSLCLHVCLPTYTSIHIRTYPSIYLLILPTYSTNASRAILKSLSQPWKSNSLEIKVKVKVKVKAVPFQATKASGF
jgi:hypothetical protein